MQDILNKDIPLGGLFSIIYRSRNIYLNNSMNTTGLSQGQVFALITLSKEDNITQDRIAELFYLDKGTVARAVRKLEDSGYICRTQDPDRSDLSYTGIQSSEMSYRSQTPLGWLGTFREGMRRARR